VPELPEAETIARDLDGALRGAVVRSVRVERADILRGITAAAFSRRLRQATVEQVHRRAKSVVLDLAPAMHLVVTPRFTGALLLDRPPEDYTCLAVALADGRQLRYRDIRRLGTVQLLDPRKFAAWSDALGPEPLDPSLTPERFSGILRGSARAVKTILMDQRKLAGVGNIYANEACWRAEVRPARRGRSLTRHETNTLLTAVRGVLEESIARRGTTFRDYLDARGGKGDNARYLAVYGRAGEPCLRCGRALRATHAIEGRATVWCQSCQK
jgi:formamidopyrimidine-DNA glycosylase